MKSSRVNSVKVRRRDFADLAQRLARGELADLREKEKTGALLVAKEAQLRLITDITPVMLTRCSRDLRYLFVNRAYAEFLGYPAERIIGAPIVEIMGEEAFAAIHPYMKRVLEGERVEFEEEVSYKRAGTRYVHVTYAPERNGQGEVVGWVGGIIDITERKRAEGRLRVRDNISRVLAQAATLKEATGKIIQALCEMGGWETGAIWLVSHTVKEMSCVDFWHAPSVEVPHFETITRERRFAPGVGLPGRVWQSGEPAWVSDVTQDANFPRAPMAARDGLHAAFCFPIKLGDEVLGAFECFSRQMREPDPDLIQLLASIGEQLGQFIERTQAEEALRQSEESMRLILNTALDAVITINARGDITDWNPQAESLFGWGKAEALGKKLTETIIPLRYRKAHECGIHRYLATGVGHLLKKRIEIAALHRDGGEFPVELAITPVFVKDQTGFTAFIRDITERKQAERRLTTNLAIARILAESPSLSDATTKILQMICETLDWQAGAMWTPDFGANVLRCLKVWHDPAARLDQFKSASYEQTFAPGVGLPGRVWMSLKPVWIPDVTQEEDFPRATVAIEDGLHAAFASPILSNEKFLAVMEFFSADIRSPDDNLLAMFRSVGSQIGQFMERKQAEEALHQAKNELARSNEELEKRVQARTAELVDTNAALQAEVVAHEEAEKAMREGEARFQAIMDNSPSMIFLKDRRGRYLHFNRRFGEAFHLSLEKAAGKTDAEIFPRAQAVAFQANDQKVIETGTAIQFDETARHDDGVHSSIVTKFPLHDADGRIYAVGGIVTDITERRRLEAEILRVSDREQRRIAQDLHDSLGQQLAGISCLSNVLKKNLAEQSSPETNNSAKIAQLLNTAVAQTRSLARGLHPVASEPNGLTYALEDLAARVTDLFKISCHFESRPPVLIEDSNVATHLYRIAQEAVNNALKHGRAQRIEIRLSSTAGRITLAVKDDGVGFKKIAGPRKGLGLRIMNYRADMIGGSLAVQKLQRRGAEVVCTLQKIDGQTRQPDNGQTIAKPKATQKNLHRR